MPSFWWLSRRVPWRNTCSLLSSCLSYTTLAFMSIGVWWRSIGKLVLAILLLRKVFWVPAIIHIRAAKILTCEQREINTRDHPLLLKISCCSILVWFEHIQLSHPRDKSSTACFSRYYRKRSVDYMMHTTECFVTTNEYLLLNWYLLNEIWTSIEPWRKKWRRVDIWWWDHHKRSVTE